MLNLFDTFFTDMRNKYALIVYPFHVVFMTQAEIDGNFNSTYGELSEPLEEFTHYGLYTSTVTYRIFTMPLTTEQYEQQIKL